MKRNMCQNGIAINVEICDEFLLNLLEKLSLEEYNFRKVNFKSLKKGNIDKKIFPNFEKSFLS